MRDNIKKNGHSHRSKIRDEKKRAESYTLPSLFLS
jgi:hypothetical protein